MRTEIVRKPNHAFLPPGTTDQILAEALAEREEFLTDRPHMRAYQREIDRILDMSGNHQGRLAVLGTMLQGKLMEIQRELCSLRQMVQYCAA